MTCNPVFGSQVRYYKQMQAYKSSKCVSLCCGLTSTYTEPERVSK